MAGKPPVFKIPPAPAKTNKGSAWQQFVNKWAARYPSLKANAADIQAAAAEAHIDPIYFASVLLTESGANYDTKNSSAGAIGIGQVMPLHVGETVPWDPTKTVTLADLHAPGFNLRWSAYYLASQIGKHGYAHAYDQGYNPGYTGGGPQQFISGWNKQYVPKTSSTAPPGPVGPQAPGGTAPVSADVKDPYVVFGASGKVSFVNSTAGVPTNAVTMWGLPMRRSQFLATWSSLDHTYLAYTGKRATAAQAAQVIQHGWSDTQVQLQLTNSGSFRGSPIWKQHAPDYVAAWQAVYGPNSKPDQKAIGQAIANGINPNAFQINLQQRPDYVNSNEFKQKTAALSGTYTQIYGVPDAHGNEVVKQAARNGYDAQQFANYLRAQPQYTSSDEFKSNAMGWAQSMGLLNTTPATEASAPLATASTPAPTWAQPNPPAAPVPAGVIPDNRATKGP